VAVKAVRVRVAPLGLTTTSTQVVNRPALSSDPCGACCVSSRALPCPVRTQFRCRSMQIDASCMAPILAPLVTTVGTIFGVKSAAPAAFRIGETRVRGVCADSARLRLHRARYRSDPRGVRVRSGHALQNRASCTRCVGPMKLSRHEKSARWAPATTLWLGESGRLRLVRMAREDMAATGDASTMTQRDSAKRAPKCEVLPTGAKRERIMASSFDCLLG
jgi:hypothetical protein